MDLENHQSRFLRLPREIRDQIYGYVLVYDKISMEAGVTKAPRSRIAVGGEIGFCDILYRVYLLRYPLCDRKTWEIPLSDLDIPEPEFQLDSNKVRMTYQLALPGKRDTPTKIDLSLFLTCKQVYSEASETFYGKNTFSFTLAFAIPTAATFLRDRPVAALRYLKSLELHLIEVEERPPGHELGRMGLHVLQYDYGIFSELCSLLASQQMSLRHLHLSFETLWVHDLHGISSLADLFEHECKQTSTAEECLEAASWVRPLLEIRTLYYLSVYWLNGRHLRAIGKIANMMGRSMFEAGQPPCKPGANPEEKVQILHQLYRREDDPLCGAVALYDPRDHTMKHWACRIYDSGQKLNRIDPGTQEDEKNNFSHPIMMDYLQKRLDYSLSTYFEWPQRQ